MTDKFLRLSKSCLSNAEKQAVIAVLDREYLGMGAEVLQFEENLTEFFGRPAVCVSSGTAALHLALQAAGISEDDEVLVQSLTYVATIQAITATGAVPIFCDVDRETLCIDSLDAEKRITSKTKAIVPVHYAGGVGALDDIYLLAEKYGLRVIEDAAHAFGTLYKGCKVGGFGDVACFSFDGIKNITSGEGGCVVTNDLSVLEKIRDIRLLGVERDSKNRYQNMRSWEFDVIDQGWRYHMSNIMAAIGIQQLRRFPLLSNKRSFLAKKYGEIFKSAGVEYLYHDFDLVVPHIFVIIIPEYVDRDELRSFLKENGVETGVHYKPNHLLSKYKTILPEGIKTVESIYGSLLSIPLHPDLSLNDIEYVSMLIIRFFSDSEALII